MTCAFNPIGKENNIRFCFGNKNPVHTFKQKKNTDEGGGGGGVRGDVSPPPRWFILIQNHHI